MWRIEIREVRFGRWGSVQPVEGGGVNMPDHAYASLAVVVRCAVRLVRSLYLGLCAAALLPQFGTWQLHNRIRCS